MLRLAADENFNNDIVRGVRDRHDGVRRNPWDEFECGHHYARAMSSWSLLTAISGYHYDAAAGRYAPAALSIMRAAAAATVLVLGVAIGGLWLRERKHRAAASGERAA